jgi:hypothetical protein
MELVCSQSGLPEPSGGLSTHTHTHTHKRERERERERSLPDF